MKGAAVPIKTKEELKAEKRKAQMIKEMEDKKSSIELKKQKKRKLLDWLFKDYPYCFSKEFPKPLMQGIDKEIALALSDKKIKKYLRPCLHTYTNSKKYYQSIVSESHRIDLMGNPVEEISEEHREHAKQKLRLLKEKKKVNQAKV